MPVSVVVLSHRTLRLRRSVPSVLHKSLADSSHFKKLRLERDAVFNTRSALQFWNNVHNDFDVLLTVHLSIFILVINQLDAQNLFYNKFISCLYMFRAHVLTVRRSKLYYTASGIITPMGGCIIQFWPPDDEHMCSKHVEAWNKLTVKQILCIKLVNY